MRKHKLARVRWQVGQTLLPEHFFIQEESLEEALRLRAELAGYPSHGVAALEWDETLLARGTLSISTLTAVMPGGLLVDVPGNAFLSPFSLEATGKSTITLYLHLLSEVRGTEDVPLYAGDPPMVLRGVERLHLSLEPAVDGAVSTLKLAVFVKNLEGLWQLDSKAWLPPLLQVGPHPFLDPLLRALDDMLRQAHNQLLSTLSDSYQRPDRLSNARRTLCEVQRLRGLREDMNNHVCPHPYQLFEALRRLYFELCCYAEALPDERMPSYRHDELAASLWGWMKLLGQGFTPEDTRTTHQPFVVKDGLLILSNLPDAVRDAGELYLLVQRKQAGERLPMDGVKLASPSRLLVVRRLALKGVPFDWVPYPKFPHAFGPDIDWYMLTKNEEWQYALREDSVAFYVTPTLEDAKVSLFWRKA